MRAGREDTNATLPETTVGSGVPGASPAVVLTLLFHPDVGRVGERAVLGPRSEVWTAAVSRTAATFAPVSGGAGEPLADEHLSRKPVVFTSRRDGAVDLDASGTPTKVVAGKVPVERRRLSPDELHRGVVLLLGGHVVLLLHVATPAPHAVSGEEHGLLGQSDGLRAVLSDVASVADLKKPVLLRGPSGSGKELVARAIHRAGRRGKAPFVAVNLGAVPASIAAAELFGADRGAFTGAVRRAGYFEQAQGGTLFLDEIGEAAVELQASLLRAIQEGEIQPLGAERPRKVDVRVVAATDADLEAKVKDGSFRAPLLSRLAAYQIWIPSLAERRDDIGRLLVRFFEEEMAAAGAGRSFREAVEAGWVPAGLVAELCEHRWPGNVRQLRNVVGHLVIPSLGQPRVTMSPAAQRLLGGAGTEAQNTGSADSPPSSGPAPSSEPSASSETGSRGPSKARAGRPATELSEAEIREALRACGWEMDAAARALGVARPSLYRAIERFPGIRTVRHLTVDEIRAAHGAAGGDLARMATALEVSERALLRRVRELGLGDA